MQAFKIILVVACLAGVASAASWHQDLNQCEQCMKLVDNWKKNITKFEDDLTAKCKLIPDKTNQDRCIAAEMKVVEHIKSTTTEQLCQETNMCPRDMSLFSRARQAFDKFIGHFHKKSQGETTQACEKCKDYVGEVQKRLPQLEKQLMDTCKKIPFQEAQEKCIEDAKAFLDFLSKYTPEEICQADHLCPAKIVPFNLAQLQQPMCSLLCQPCKQIAQQVKAGVPQAKDQLKKLCKNCGASENVKKCEKAIDNFIENIEKKSPAELCAEIGFCKKQ